MKKFLFTLFALLIAGSAMADTHSYLYVDDMTITAEQNVPGSMIQVFVKASFDARVSAFDVNIEFPESVTLFSNGYLRKGDDLTISWTDFFGDTQSAEAGLQGNANHAIAAFTAAGYENGALESYGVAKWEAGEYDNMYSFYFLVPEGGLESFTFTTSSAVSAGHDSRGGVVDETQASERIDHTTTVTVEQAQEPAPAATISNEGNVVTAAVYDNEGNVVERDVELYIVTTDPETGEEVLTKVDNSYTVPQTFETQTITFRAKTIANDDESGDTWSEDTEITIPAKADKQAPKPTITNNNGVVSASCEGHQVKFYYKNDQGEWVEAESFTLPANETFDDVTYYFQAYTVANGTDDNIDSDYQTAEFTVEGKADKQAPKPTITNNNGVVSASCEGHQVKFYYKNDQGEWVEAESFTLPENTTFDDKTYYFQAYTVANGTDDNVDSDYETAEFTVEGKADAQAPEPTFRLDGDKLYAEQGNLTVELYKKDGENWVKVNNPYEGLPTENTSYTDDIVIEFKAITLADNETYNIDSEWATYTYTLNHLTKKTCEKPTIVRDDANMTDDICPIVITPDPATDGALEYTAAIVGAKGNDIATLNYERKDEAYTVHVEARTKEGPTYLASEWATADIVIPAKPAPNVYQTPDPKIEVTVDNENQKVIITVTGEGTVTAAVENANGTTNYTDPDGDGKIVIEIPFGDNPDIVNVTASAKATTVPEGYDAISETPGTAQENGINIPAKPKQTAKPTIDVSFGGETGSHYAVVTLQNNDTDPVVYEYSFNGTDWITYNGPVTLDPSYYGDVTIYARAKAENKTWSEPSERTFTLGDDATSVNELINGKTVAGVRYFNMAGQEMQEANGITIVVTTYTDGTTSAVKVIK